ncbi:hypothetical protein ACJMK2_022643 [Sinanodonta woodiana]|uniref:CCHC-type domain-containing protein n=1 Tax=Sinanodonta woodiana TaxID=1069815 RepID=A0ABD3TJN8_SINWO
MLQVQDGTKGVITIEHATGVRRYKECHCHRTCYRCKKTGYIPHKCPPKNQEIQRARDQNKQLNYTMKEQNTTNTPQKKNNKKNPTKNNNTSSTTTEKSRKYSETERTKSQKEIPIIFPHNISRKSHNSSNN